MSTAGHSPRSTMRRDLLSAYAASAARVLSWVIVSAVVFRSSAAQFAVLALIRGTLSLLNYTTLGLAPAMVRLLAMSNKDVLPPINDAAPRPALPIDNSPQTLAYETPAVADPMLSIYSNALILTWVAAGIGFGLTYAYSAFVTHIHTIPGAVSNPELVVASMGFGTFYRLMSDASGAVIQVKGRIARDNSRIIFCEIVWAVLVVIGLHSRAEILGAAVVAGAAYGISGMMQWALRSWEAKRELGMSWLHWRPQVDRKIQKWLVATGSMIAVAQLADFLYAPTDFFLINRLISPETVAAYAPAVQIDAGLLLLVGALAAVLLPKAALAHAAGDITSLRRYYIRGTLISAALLFVAGASAYSLSPLIFRLWLGNPLPLTQAILPLVLIHTLLGGSSGVGRSILLGVGKVKPFAIAAIVAGVANVLLSYSFVKFGGLGIRGIVYGTILAVFGRCVIWQPWYVLRTLRRESSTQLLDATVDAIPELPL